MNTKQKKPVASSQQPLPNILVVDDEPVTGKSLELMLSDEGYLVDVSESGYHALELMEKGSYDLVLSDIVMDDIGGLELLRKAKGKYPHIPFIMITGYASLDTAVEALRSGAYDYLKKPINQDELLLRVRNAMETERLRREKERAEQEKDDLVKQIKDYNENLERIVEERTKTLKRVDEALRISNKELLQEHNQRKLLSKRLIELLENDRHQLAMELHDHIGQTLTTLKMELELIPEQHKEIDAALEDRIKTAKNIALQAMKDIKDVAYGLTPTTLDNLGLAPSLHFLFDDFKNCTDIEIHFFTQNVPKRFDKEKELAIFRIIQEAMNNIIKHAQARNVFINLLKKNKSVTLSVEDDGAGFEVEKVMKVRKRKGPLGLLIMQERIEQLDGEFTIESRKGFGTHILAEIPL